MGTRLFPITLDLFATTLIAGPSHPASLLQLLRVGQGRAPVGCDIQVVMIVIKVSIVVVVREIGVIVPGKRTRRSSHGEEGSQEASWK